MKVFHSREEAKKYADKNYFLGTYNIEETRNGNFRIAEKDDNQIVTKQRLG